MTSKHRFVLLDGLRGTAALCVMLHHAEQFYGHPQLFAHAYLAVDFFFMLSGFVLNGTYAPRFVQGLALGQFMLIRAKRLWPTLAVGVLLGTAVRLVQGYPFDNVARDMLAGLVLFPIVRGSLGLFILDGVEWSLFFEAIANAVHCLLIWRISARGLAVLIAVLTAMMLVISAQHGGIGVGDRGVSFSLGFPRVALPYLIGVLLQRLWVLHPIRLQAPAVVMATSLPLVFLLAAQPALAQNGLTDPLIVVLVFPAIIWVCAGISVSGRLAHYATLGGAMSYPLYALHLPLIGLGDTIAHSVPPVVGILSRLAALTLCLGGAWVMSKYLDRIIGFRPSQRR